MIKRRNKFQLGLMLAALPFVATAAASAHQWMASSAEISAPEAIVQAELPADRIHNIALNRNGGIEGRVTTLKNSEGEGLSDLKVYFVRNGEIAKEATTDQNGTFRIDDVAEGAYSFVATGKSGFAAYGVNVIAHNGSNRVNAMEAAAVSPRFSVVKEILENNLPQEIASEILEGASNITEEFVSSNRIKLQDGNLVGNIVPLFGEIASVEGTNVHIIKNDEQIATAQTDANGFFSVADLEPGVYDFVAAGPTGIAAVSFQAIDENGASVDSDEIPVSIEPAAIQPAAAAAALPFQDIVTADIPSALNVATTGSMDAGFVGQQVGFAGQEMMDTTYDASAPIQYASESVVQGGACGASCGSCGDFSGFNSCNSCGGGVRGGGVGGGRLFGGRLAGGASGLRRLALLGGIAGAVVAISADSDSGDATPSE